MVTDRDKGENASRRGRCRAVYCQNIRQAVPRGGRRPERRGARACVITSSCSHRRYRRRCFYRHRDNRALAFHGDERIRMMIHGSHMDRESEDLYVSYNFPLQLSSSKPNSKPRWIPIN